MSRRHVSSFVAVLCVSFLTLSGCDDNEFNTAIGPSSLDAKAPFISRAVSVRASHVTPLETVGALCPLVPPFQVPINLTVSALGASDLSLREIRMQFVDSSGVTGGVRTIIGNELGSLFPSTRIPAFGARTFPVSLAFGCIGGRTGIADVVVVAADSAGRESRTSMRLNVR